MSAPASAHPFRLTGWHVLAMLVAFFGVTFVVDGFMMVRAYKTFPGEVSTTPYEDGLAYDSQLDQQARQAVLGWRMGAGFVGGAIRLTAADRSGAPLEGLRITARLERPATEQGRVSIQFRPIAPGLYEARPGSLTGAWDLRVSAYDAGGRRFDAERRLTAP